MQNTDTLSKYGQSFQTKVLASLITDVKLLDTLSEIIHPKFFESEANKWIAEEIVNYYDEYKKSPTIDVFKSEISKIDERGFQTNIVEQLKSVFTKVGDSDLDYVKKEFSSFCINQNLKQAIVDSVDLLKAGSYDKIKDLIDKAMKVGVDSDMGHDYLLELDERTDEVNRNTVPTDWECLNELMDGGLGPGELGVVVAPSGVGKTWILCTLGAAAVKAGLNVVHYSLELSEYYVGQRYDTVFTQIPSTEVKERKDEVADKIGRLSGRLLIKYFPPKGISPKRIESHIEKMTAAGNKPDLVIIDYADLLLSHTNKSDSTYGEQGGVYIELRGMGGELGIPVWTASQTNRCHFVEDLVDTKHGKVQIGKIKKDDEILTHDGYKKVTHVFEKETQPVYKIKLKSGKEINISAEHNVPTQYGKLKSIRTGLKVGDKLFTKKS